MQDSKSVKTAQPARLNLFTHKKRINSVYKMIRRTPLNPPNDIRANIVIAEYGIDDEVNKSFSHTNQLKFSFAISF